MSNYWNPTTFDTLSLDTNTNRAKINTMETQLDFVKGERELWKNWGLQGKKADNLRRAAACFHEAYAFLWMTAKYEYHLEAKKYNLPGQGPLPVDSLRGFLQESFYYFDDSVSFSANPDVELSKSQAQGKIPSFIPSDLVDDKKLEEIQTSLHDVADHFDTNQQRDLVNPRKKCVTALEILRLMQEQVTDARNVAYRKAQDTALYPQQFKLAGLSLAKSEENMRERGPRITGWLKYYLGLPSAISS